MPAGPRCDPPRRLEPERRPFSPCSASARRRPPDPRPGRPSPPHGSSGAAAGLCDQRLRSPRPVVHDPKECPDRCPSSPGIVLGSPAPPLLSVSISGRAAPARASEAAGTRPIAVPNLWSGLGEAEGGNDGLVGSPDQSGRASSRRSGPAMSCQPWTRDGPAAPPDGGSSPVTTPRQAPPAAGPAPAADKSVAGRPQPVEGGGRRQDVISDRRYPPPFQPIPWKKPGIRSAGGQARPLSKSKPPDGP